VSPQLCGRWGRAPPFGSDFMLACACVWSSGKEGRGEKEKSPALRLHKRSERESWGLSQHPLHLFCFLYIPKDQEKRRVGVTASEAESKVLGPDLVVALSEVKEKGKVDAPNYKKGIDPCQIHQPRGGKRAGQSY